MNAVMVKYFLPTLAIGMLSFGFVHILHSKPDEAKLAPPANPPRSPYKDTVAAAGVVEACTENIAIGNALSGVILDVYVPASQVGKTVMKGEALFRVDDRHLRAQLKAQEANLLSARAQLAKLEAMPRPEEVPASEAKVQTAEVNLRLMKDLSDRSSALLERQAVSKEEATQRLLNQDMAKYQLEQAKADLALLKAGAWKADIEVARAAVAMAQAQVEQTSTEIERATVRAPIDGQVLQVNVRPGELVGVQPGPALVMMGDLTRYHVRVDIDEHDIPRFQPGTPGKAFLRGHPEHEVKLSFVRVERFVTPKKSLTGDNTERVDTRVLQAIYSVDKADVPIYIGQQLDVFIDVR